jgi:hypothetical protein
VAVRVPQQLSTTTFKELQRGTSAGNECWERYARSESTRRGGPRDAPVVVIEPQMNESASTLDATNHALPRLKLDTTHASRKLYLRESRCPLSGRYTLHDGISPWW